MYSVTDLLLLKIKKLEEYQTCVMYPINHRGINLILIGRSMIQPVCVFDVYLLVSFDLMA